MRYYSSFDWTYVLVLVGLLIGLLAQNGVRRAYQEYSQIHSAQGIPASTVVMDLLRRNGNDRVTLQLIGGELTDNYNPKDETLSLSQTVYDSDSIAAIAVAAHEAGHAMQKMEEYKPLILRSFSVPAVQFGSQAAMPIFIAGLLLSFRPLLYVGIGLFALSVLFALITLPVEFDASRRAVQMLQEGGYLNDSEIGGAKKVLRAAAMTYVASALASLLNLVRLIMIAQRGSSRRRD
ncbi:MAG: zinc metallopeptidase [Clostridia bacterium]|nr:zinc metallopeptidase [Clostridia bacterium]